MEFFTKIVGVTFNNTGSNTENRQRIIGDLYKKGNLEPGQVLSLEPEFNNPYDSNAIKVIGPDGRQLGYLSKAVAASIAPLIRDGKTYQAFVSNITGGGDVAYGVNIKIVEAECSPMPNDLEIFLSGCALPVETPTDWGQYADTNWGNQIHSLIKVFNDHCLVLLSDFLHWLYYKTEGPCFEIYIYDVENDEIINTYSIQDYVYDFVALPDGSIVYSTKAAESDESSDANSLILRQIKDENDIKVLDYPTAAEDTSLIEWNGNIILLGGKKATDEQHFLVMIEFNTTGQPVIKRAFAYDGECACPKIDSYCQYKNYLIFSVADNSWKPRIPFGKREIYIANLITGVVAMLKCDDICNIHFLDDKLCYNVNKEGAYIASIDFENLEITKETKVATGVFGTLRDGEIIYTNFRGPSGIELSDGSWDVDPSASSTLYAMDVSTRNIRKLGTCDFEIQQALFFENYIVIVGTSPENPDHCYAINDYKNPKFDFHEIIYGGKELLQSNVIGEVNDQIVEPIAPKPEIELPKYEDIYFDDRVSNLDVVVSNDNGYYGIGHAVRLRKFCDHSLVAIDFSQGNPQRSNLALCTFPLESFGKLLRAFQGGDEVDFMKYITSIYSC